MMRTPSESRASGKGAVSSAHFSAEFLNVWPRERPFYLTILVKTMKAEKVLGWQAQRRELSPAGERASGTEAVEHGKHTPQSIFFELQ